MVNGMRQQKKGNLWKDHHKHTPDLGKFKIKLEDIQNHHE